MTVQKTMMTEFAQLAQGEHQSAEFEGCLVLKCGYVKIHFLTLLINSFL